MGISEWPGESTEGLNWDGTLSDAARDAFAGRSRMGISSDEEHRLARLVRTIEGEIVPRLVLSRRVKIDAAPPQLRRGSMPDEIDVKEMVRLLLAHDASVASAYVEMVRQRGATLEMICLDLLAPTARELGLLWEEDECNFMQVTVGLCRLHQVLRELSSEFGVEDSCHESSKRILLAPFPGEQHTFGVTLVAQFLRRAGWDVWPEIPKTITELLESTRANSFAAVGLSVGCETQLDSVAETIRAIRKSSRNRAVGVLIGGPIFVVKPGLAADMGADATGCDGRDAVRQAERIRSEWWRRELGI